MRPVILFMSLLALASCCTRRGQSLPADIMPQVMPHAAESAAAPQTIVIGFVGGKVASTDAIRNEIAIECDPVLCKRIEELTRIPQQQATAPAKSLVGARHAVPALSPVSASQCCSSLRATIPSCLSLRGISQFASQRREKCGLARISTRSR